MDTQERIEMLQEAQEKLREAVLLVESALQGTNLISTASAYLIPDLEMAIDNESSWIGINHGNIGGLIESLMDDDGEENEDEQD